MWNRKDLVAVAAPSYRATFELTNPDIPSLTGTTIKRRRIGIKWERIIESGKLTLLERITFRNFDIEPIDFPISMTFQAGFQDIFIIHGAKGKKTGKLRTPLWDNGVLRFSYIGVDKMYRGLAIHLPPGFEPTSEDSAKLDVHLAPGESEAVQLSLVIAESPVEEEGQPHGYTRSDFNTVADAMHRAAKEWTVKHTVVESDSRLLNQTMRCSPSDHLILRSELDNDHYFAAGLPWFCALFGRDSLIAALQMLAYSPSLAEQTLRLLARFQGQRVDPSRDEEPGKIHHELRRGELANSKQIVQTPYYGTVDATPLFIILLSEHAAWTGDLTLFHHLRSNVDAALEWISKYGVLDKDGYLKYQSKSKKGAQNQGWKDSGNSMVNEDGSLAPPPIALVEVQGYVYLAKTLVAELYRRAGAMDRADELLQEAAKLRSHFNRDFWIEDKNFYAMALQQHNRPASVISSNPGQALWSGIVDSNRVNQVADCLMGEDMFSGWGVRTLSEHERRYNPIVYHLGTVWPHDNSIIAIGLRKYGLDDAFQRVFSGILRSRFALRVSPAAGALFWFQA
ncbi:MAG: amylo-alpha-1,6-glucosidase [Terriglobia bacterium]